MGPTWDNELSVPAVREHPGTGRSEGIDMSESRSVFRPARVSEYVDWLRGYLAGGGEITHAYDYRLNGFLVACRDFSTGGECGVNAAQIVVPAGVRHTGGDLGHNSLYFMDGFTERGHGFVPIFADPEFDALPGVAEAREAEEARHVAFERQMRQHEAEAAAAALTSDLSAYRSRR
jgi:hypothetical protein